jgi:hypothetical protein
MSNWKFFWCSLLADDFTVSGISFVNEAFRFSLTGKSVEAVDPIYGGTQVTPVYRLEYEGHSFEVAHMEWTPGVYLAFADEATLPFCTPKYRWDPVSKWVRVD